MPEIPEFTKAEIAWDCFFTTEMKPRFYQMPHEICQLLEKEDGVMQSIVERLCGDKRYTIRITIESQENNT